MHKKCKWTEVGINIFKWISLVNERFSALQGAGVIALPCSLHWLNVHYFLITTLVPIDLDDWL